MDNLKLFAGEDAAIAGELSCEAGEAAVSLDMFDLHIELSTTPLGHRITCSTLPDSGLPIVRSGENTFSVNISGAETARLSEGIVTLTATLTHKQTGVRTIAEQKSITIVKPQTHTLS
jgi:hypothetical protein